MKRWVLGGPGERLARREEGGVERWRGRRPTRQKCAMIRRTLTGARHTHTTHGMRMTEDGEKERRTHLESSGRPSTPCNGFESRHGPRWENEPVSTRVAEGGRRKRWKQGKRGRESEGARVRCVDIDQGESYISEKRRELCHRRSPYHN
jgi:hypothetical protein